MRTLSARALARLAGLSAALFAALMPLSAHASERDIDLPDFASRRFIGEGAFDGRSLLLVGIVVAVLGLVFGLVQYMQLKALPVHKAMLEISELIYATCKQYMITQGEFILLLWLFIGAVIFVYFGVLSSPPMPVGQVVIVLL